MTTTPIPTGPTGPVSTGPSKLLITLIAVIAVLVIALVAVFAFVLGQGAGGGNINASNQTPTPNASDSATPVAEPTDGATDGNTDGGGQAPVDNSVRFTSFSADLTVECDPTGNDEKPSPSISWDSANAAHVYWTPNAQEANGDNGYEVGKSGDQDDMSFSKGPGERYEFPCNHRETFDTTITLVGSNGQKVSKTVTFTDVNWNTGGSDDDD